MHIPLRTRVAAVAAALALTAAIGCAREAAAPRAAIQASPLMVPPGDGPGVTTITWDTGDGSWAEVYLLVPGQPSVLFSAGPKGSQQAPWIHEGPEYEFRLFAGTTRELFLGSVTVRRGTPSDPMRVAAFATRRYLMLLVLTVFAYVLGHSVVSRWSSGSALNRTVLSIGAGLGLTALGVFVLGVLGLLSRPAVIAVMLIAAVFAWKAWRDLAVALRRLTMRKLAVGVAATAAALVVLFPVLLLPLYPPTAFDATMYHLPYARSYVDAQAVRPVLDARFPVFPQANEMLFAVALLLADDVAAQMTQLLMMLLTAAALYAWGAGTFSRRAGLLAAAIWMASPLVVRLAGSAFIDLGLACFATLSVYALYRRGSEPLWQRALVAGGFAGLAAGAKYSGLYFVLALGAAVLVQTVRARQLQPLAGFAVAAALLGGPWYAYNAYHSGNPVFPFLPGLFGSGFWAAQDTGYIHTLVDRYGTGGSLWEFIRLPWSLSFGDAPQREEISPWLFAALPAASIAALVDRRLRPLVLVSLGFLIFWFWSAPVVRYLLPILPVMSLAAAAIFDRLVTGVARPGRAVPAAIAAACAVALVLPARDVAADVIDRAGLPPVNAGERERHLEKLVSYRAYRFLNQHRGANYAVYGLYSEEMEYFANGRAIGDWFGEGRYSRILPALRSGESLYTELRALGADFLLVRTDRWPVSLPADAFFAARFKLVHEEPHARLFELVPAGAGD